MSETRSDFTVIHLATGSVGGAGLAARRLNKALNDAGFNSKFYSPIRESYSPGKNEFEITRSPTGKLKSALSTILQKNFHNISFFSLFSVNVIRIREIHKIATKENSILQFHNWFNLVSQKTILKLAKSGYRVVLTMHDERFFTGGCHYALECRGFTNGCHSCPRLSMPLKEVPARNLQIAKKLMNEAYSNIYFIAPSKWLSDEARSSELLKNANLIHISNTLGEDLTSIPQIHFRKEIYHLNIGIASMDHTSFVKGGDTLQAVIEIASLKKLPINFIYFNQLQANADAEKEFWGKLDYLLSLSRADNSPNVIHEAKFRGIPVISTAIGGITELLTSPPDVEISGTNTHETIVEILESLIGLNGSLDLQLTNKAFVDYSGQSVSKHIDLYKTILAK